ncbi:VOC family protein [Nisaea sp.]|uniref:VOC family protein n=1 Tax=Nisaea sp. TaxID=2024842 RepID=UPI003B529C21
MSAAGGGPKVRTCLWYDRDALPAAEFYCSLLPDSRIDSVSRYRGRQDRHYRDGPEPADPGEVMSVSFTLAGTPYQGLNGGPHFRLDWAVSIVVGTEDQTETDRLWSALTGEGGSEGQCGWLKDRFGLSWQIVPKRAAELLSGPGSARVWPALMQMSKIEIAALEAAAG